jgi:hypothetical protein
VKRDPRLVRLSWDHHHGLVMARRIARDLPGASDDAAGRLYADLVAFWAAGLLPHFRAENECLLARLVRHVPHEHETVALTQRDHLDIEALVATMRDTTDPSARRATLAEFGVRLREHIRWEEAVLFAEAERSLTPLELDELEDDLAERLPGVVPAPSPE